MFSASYIILFFLVLPGITIAVIIGLIYFLFKLFSHQPKGVQQKQEISSKSILPGISIPNAPNTEIAPLVSNKSGEILSTHGNLKIGKKIGTIILILAILNAILAVAASNEDIEGKLLADLPLAILPLIFLMPEIVFPYYVEGDKNKDNYFILLNLHPMVTILTLLPLYAVGGNQVIGLIIIALRVFLVSLNLIYLFDIRKSKTH